MKKYGRFAQYSIGIVMSFVVLSLSTEALGIQTDQIVVTFEQGLLVGAPTVGAGTVLARTATGEKAINKFTNVFRISNIIPRGWKAYSLSGPYVCDVLGVQDIDAYIQDLAASADIASVALAAGDDSYVVAENVQQWFPSTQQARFCDQWQLHRRVGDETQHPDDWCSLVNDPAFGDHDMDLPQAWGISRGRSDVLVGVIDIGFDWSHPDLGGDGPPTQVAPEDSLFYYTNGVLYTNSADPKGDASLDGRPGNAFVDDDNDGKFDEDSNNFDYRNDGETDVVLSQTTTVTGNTIFDSTANYTAGALVGMRFYGNNGRTDQFFALIESNTSNTITTAPPFTGFSWEDFIDPGDVYRVGDGLNNNESWPDDVIDDAGWTNDLADDDDENGVVDDVHGYDFLGNSSPVTNSDLYPGEDYDVPDNDVFSYAGHGTWVASQVASASDHGQMLGVAPGVKILPVRAGYAYEDSSGCAQQRPRPLDYIVSVAYCIEMGVDIIVTAGGGQFGAGFSNMMQAAVDSGIVFVNGAGNWGSLVVPSFVDVTPRLLVSGLNNDDEAWVGQFSETAYGDWVDIAAAYFAIAPVVTPCVNPTAIYSTYFGTSLSGPMVGGVAALVKSVYPQFTRDDIINKVKASVDDIYSNGMNSNYVGLLGTGRANAYKAITFYGNVAATGDTTWSHNIWIGGDARVPEGSTLTIAAGDTVRVAIDDLLSAGLNPNEIEFVIDGDLQVKGSSSAPVVFERFDDSGQYWEYDATFSISGETFTLGGLGCATIASAAHSPLVPDNGTASQVFSIEVQENASLDSVDVDLAGLGLNGTTLQLLDDGQGEDLLASDGIFTSAPFTALVSGGLGYSVDVTAYATAGGYTRRSVAVEVPPVMAVLNDVSSESGLSYQGTPYSGVVSQIDGGTLEDLVVTISSGFPSVAYRNLQISPSGGPSFGQWAVVQGQGARGIASADYDNDGDEDLFIAHGQSPKLYRNDAGTYVDVTSSVGLATLAAGSTVGCWGDYDNDGWLDLFVARCVVPGTEPPGYDNIESANHRLFRNLGGSGGGFADVTSAAGLQSLASASVAASWGDIDNDGDLDLAVLSLAHPPEHEMAMLVNQGDGTFIDEFMSRLFYVGTDIYYGTGVVWADMNNDGWLDMAVSCAGAGSQVLLNDGQGRFPASLSVLLPPVIGAAGTCYSGLQVFDHDLDGWQDILLVSRDQSKPSRLFLGRQVTDGIEYLENTHNVALAHSSNGMGVVAADFTADGDVDVFVGRPVASGEFFYKTDNQADANSLGRRYVKVRLDSPGIDSVNRQGVGAVVTVTAGGLVQTQIVDGGSGRGGQKDRTLIFGLDDYSSESVVATVTWPGGTVQSDVDLIVSGAGVGETVNIISDAKPVLSNVKAEMLIDPVTNVIDWRFSWDTTTACKTQADLVTIDQEGVTNPCLPGWTTVTPTSPGTSYTYKAGDNGGYSHVLTISNWDCNQNCSYWYTAKSDGGLKSTTSSPILKRVKFCPSQF